MSGVGESVFLEACVLDGRTIDLYGIAYPETADGAFDFYELYEGGVCLNEGDPLPERPSVAEIKQYLSPKE